MEDDQLEKMFTQLSLYPGVKIVTVSDRTGTNRMGPNRYLTYKGVEIKSPEDFQKMVNREMRDPYIYTSTS